MPQFDVPCIGRSDGKTRMVAFNAPTLEAAYQIAIKEGHMVEAPRASRTAADPNDAMLKLHGDMVAIAATLERIDQRLAKARLVRAPVGTIAVAIIIGVILFSVIMVMLRVAR